MGLQKKCHAKVVLQKISVRYVGPWQTLHCPLTLVEFDREGRVGLRDMVGSKG